MFRLRNDGFLEVEAQSGWYVKPIDFTKLDDLYSLHITIKVASILRLCARPDEANSALDHLKSLWLVGAAGNSEVARVHLDITERIRIIHRLDFTRADRIAAT